MKSMRPVASASMLELISKIQPATNSEWDDIWGACNYATYFQSRYWAEIWSEYKNGTYRPAPLIARFTNGQSAILPFTEKKILFGSTQSIQSSPAGTYGGWMSECDLAEPYATMLFDFIRSNFANIYWRHNPYSHYPEPFGENAIRDYTHILRLSEVKGKAKSLQNRGHRSALSKSIRQGITIHRAETIKDWKDYFDIYKSSISRWGGAATNKYNRKLFDILYYRSKESSDITLWLAKYFDSAVAGAICLSSKNIVAYWHGAALAAHFDKRPVNLLMTRIVEHYAESGKLWFDFNPSGGHQGVSAFKEGFGASKISTNIFSQSSLIVKAARVIEGRTTWKSKK